MLIISFKLNESNDDPKSENSKNDDGTDPRLRSVPDEGMDRNTERGHVEDSANSSDSGDQSNIKDVSQYENTHKNGSSNNRSLRRTISESCDGV